MIVVTLCIPVLVATDCKEIDVRVTDEWCAQNCFGGAGELHPACDPASGAAHQTCSCAVRGMLGMFRCIGWSIVLGAAAPEGSYVKLAYPKYCGICTDMEGTQSVCSFRVLAWNCIVPVVKCCVVLDTYGCDRDHSLHDSIGYDKNHMVHERMIQSPVG